MGLSVLKKPSLAERLWVQLSHTTVINKHLLIHPYRPLLGCGRTLKKHILTATCTIEYLYNYIVNRLVQGIELIAYYIN
jgi:hypothetical protein